MATAEAAPVLDYANPLPAHPVTSDIVVDRRADGFAFIIPRGSGRRALGVAIASALVALLVIAFTVMIIRDGSASSPSWIVIVLLFMTGSIAALASFARVSYLRSAHPTVIVTEGRELLWHRPTLRGMRWSRWEPGSIRGVTAQSAGHRIDFRQVGNLVVVAQSHWRTTVLAQRDLVEMRWLADCLHRLVAT